MARTWPLRLRSLYVDFCASERVLAPESCSAGLGPLRSRSLHAGFWAGERVLASESYSAGLCHLGLDVLIRRLLCQ
ncbi:hypothetical protein F9B82_11780 [Lacticaseibacillus casei]|nr:hypothetical protein F9B82_11780 [Lacticaseibacillus casei]